jgi:hypothetical protein
MSIVLGQNVQLEHVVRANAYAVLFPFATTAINNGGNFAQRSLT